MKLLITGGAGFLGSNLTAEAIRRSCDVAVLDNLTRFGAHENLQWLRSLGKFNFNYCDTRNADDVTNIVASYQPDVVFHVAGQVAMTTSLARPRMDFETNVLGTFNVLEALRQWSPKACLIYSSTNKVYGDLEDQTYLETPTRYVCPRYPKGFPETIALDFRTPYGCSKGAADQYVLDYGRRFGLRTIVFRHSSMYGGRQFATYDQGWIGWFCMQALLTKQNPIHRFTMSGNGKQVRDVLHAEDMVRLYFQAMESTVHAEAFNIGGGSVGSLSLLELFSLLEELTGVKLNVDALPPRASDQKVFVADIAKAGALLNWCPKVSTHDGLTKMIDWCVSTL